MMKLLIERQMRKERSDSSSADFNYFISSLDLLNSFILKFLPGLFYFILFCLFRAIPATYGGSQAR